MRLRPFDEPSFGWKASPRLGGRLVRWIRMQPAEMVMVTQVGLMRQLDGLTEQRPDKHGVTEPGWNYHIEGACGEYVVALLLKVPWQPTINTFKQGHDVADYQVRTRSRLDYDLQIRSDDKAATYILVVGKCPDYGIIGYYVHDGDWRALCERHGDWLQRYAGREPAIFVPQIKTRPIAELLRGRA